jgi:hypothetical protein
MATTTVSVGSNQSIATVTPSSASGSNPYTVAFGSSPGANAAVGDIVTMDDSANTGTTFIYLLTAISGSNYTLKYCSGGTGADSPTNITDEYGDQQDAVFKRAFSTITLFEAMVDDSSPSYWGSSDDVVGELHSDSTFTDATVTFDNKQSLSSVKLTVNSDDRHDGTAESGALLKPTSGSGHNVGIIKIGIDDFTIEWLDISADSLDSTNTNKFINIATGAGDCTIRNMLMHNKGGNPGSTGPTCIASGLSLATSNNWYFLNNIIYSLIETSNDSVGAINIRSFQGNLYIYNNTIYKLTSQGGSKDAVGMRFGDGTHIVANIKNNIVAGLTEGDIAAAYWMDETPNSNRVLNSATNLSDDTTDAAKDAEDFDVNKNDSTALIGKTLGQIDFVSTSAGSEDLHLDTSSVCLEAGTDLGTTGGVNIDINGVDRDATGVTWDIGAHQKSTAATTGSPAFFLFMD